MLQMYSKDISNILTTYVILVCNDNVLYIFCIQFVTFYVLGNISSIKINKPLQNFHEAIGRYN